MPILQNDIRLLQSHNMHDVPEGGGAPSGVVIPDGVSNAIFKDVSDADRAIGAVKLRKIFQHVNTPDTDTFLGSLLTCTQPTDPQISTLLFSNQSTFDTRADAANRVAAYKYYGAVWHGFMLESHPKGIRQLRIFQTPDTELPPIGKTLYIVQNEGLPTQFGQYVQVSRVNSAERSFVGDDGKPYKALVVTCDLTTPLERDFAGTEANRFFRRGNGAALVRDTFVADAGSYKGSSKLKSAAAIGDMSAKLKDVFTQIVPSSRTESPLINMFPSGQSASLVPAGDGRVQIVTTQNFSSADVVNVGNAIVPESLQCTTSVGTLTDKGGQLLNGSSVVGTVKYDAGEIVYTAGFLGGQKTITYKPAVAILHMADSAMLLVTAENRALNWSMTTPVAPAKGNVAVSYRVGQRWYTLHDDGSGVLRGSDSSFGIGQVLYSTNTITLNCGALPEVGSAILFFWGSTGEYLDMTAQAQRLVKRASLVLPLGEVVAPDGMTIAWSDGGEQTATVAAGGEVTGTLTGGGTVTGVVDVVAKEILLQPALLPPPETVFTVTYLPKGVAHIKQSANALCDGAGLCTGNLGANVRAHSVDLAVDVTPSMLYSQVGRYGDEGKAINPRKLRVRFTDDGNGKLICRTGAHAGQQMGTINYITGDFSVATSMSTAFEYEHWNKVFVSSFLYTRMNGTGVGFNGTQSEQLTITKPDTLLGTIYLNSGGKASVEDGAAMVGSWVLAQAGSPPSKTVNIVASGLRIDLLGGASGSIQSGSFRANIGGKQIYDEQGSVYLTGSTATRTYTGAAI